MSIEQKLAKRLKSYREERNISLESLSEQTGLSMEFLTALEENNFYPHLGPLQKIARCLGVRLGTFLDDEETDDPIICRNNEVSADLILQQSRNSHASHVYFPLGKGKSDRNMEPFLITILPNPHAERKTSSHQGEEFMMVIKGALMIIYGQETHILTQGDTIYYNSIVPHSVSAYGDEPAEILGVVYHP